MSDLVFKSAVELAQMIRDRPIVDIALQCRFNSHRHLGKQFRQLTEVTPKAFRLYQS